MCVVVLSLLLLWSLHWSLSLKLIAQWHFSVKPIDFRIYTDSLLCWKCCSHKKAGVVFHYFFYKIFCMKSFLAFFYFFPCGERCLLRLNPLAPPTKFNLRPPSRWECVSSSFPPLVVFLTVVFSSTRSFSLQHTNGYRECYCNRCWEFKCVIAVRVITASFIFNLVWG